MVNPILTQIGQSRVGQVIKTAQTLKSTLRSFQEASTPQAAFNKLLMSNPQFREVIQLVQANGGDPEKTFYKLAQENGIDPQQVLDLFK